MLVSGGAEPEKRAPRELTPKEAGLAATAYYPQPVSPIRVAQPHFERTFNEAIPLSKYINDLRPKIQKRFLDDRIFSWSSRFFWIVFFLSVVSLRQRTNNFFD